MNRYKLRRGTYYSKWNGGHVSYSWCLRRPQTTQERRRWFRDVETCREYPELRLRARRSFRGLPNAWDDIPIGVYDDRSWKRLTYNRHQYNMTDM